MDCAGVKLGSYYQNCCCQKCREGEGGREIEGEKEEEKKEGLTDRRESGLTGEKKILFCMTEVSVCTCVCVSVCVHECVYGVLSNVAV